MKRATWAPFQCGYSVNARTALMMRDRSFAGNFIISAASSLAMPSEECSTTSCSSVSADTPSAFAIFTNVSSFGGFTPRSITLIWVELRSTIAARSSCVSCFFSLAAFILLPIAPKSTRIPPSRTSCCSEIIITKVDMVIQKLE